MALGSMADTEQRSTIVALIRIMYQSASNALAHKEGIDSMSPDLVPEIVRHGLHHIDPKTWPEASLSLVDFRMLVKDIDGPTRKDMERENFFRNTSRIYDAVSTVYEAYLQAERLELGPTPVPMFQTQYVILVTFLATLPLTMIQTLGYITPVACGCVAFAFASLDAIGREMDDPFGDDPHDLDLGRMEHIFQHNVALMYAHVLACEQYLTPLVPPEQPAEPEGVVLQTLSQKIADQVEKRESKSPDPSMTPTRLALNASAASMGMNLSMRGGGIHDDLVSLIEQKRASVVTDSGDTDHDYDGDKMRVSQVRDLSTIYSREEGTSEYSIMSSRDSGDCDGDGWGGDHVV